MNHFHLKNHNNNEILFPIIFLKKYEIHKEKNNYIHKN